MTDKIDMNIIKQKSAFYTIETTNIIGAELIGNRIYVLKMMVKYLVVFNSEIYSLRYNIKGIDEGYFREQYKELLKDIDDINVLSYLKKNEDKIYENFKNSIKDKMLILTEIESSRIEKSDKVLTIKDYKIGLIRVTSKHKKEYKISLTEATSEYIKECVDGLLKKDETKSKIKKLDIDNEEAVVVNYESIFLVESKITSYVWICEDAYCVLNKKLYLDKQYESLLKEINIIDVLEIKEVKNGLKFENIEIITEERSLLALNINGNTGRNKMESNEFTLIDMIRPFHVSKIKGRDVIEISCEDGLLYLDRLNNSNFVIKNNKLKALNLNNGDFEDFIEDGFNIKDISGELYKVLYSENKLIYDAKEKAYLAKLMGKNIIVYEKSYDYGLVEKHKDMKKLSTDGVKYDVFKICKDKYLNAWFCLGSYKRLKIDTKRVKKGKLESLLNKISFKDEYEDVNLFVPLNRVENMTKLKEISIINNIKEIIYMKILSKFTDSGIVENKKEGLGYYNNEKKEILYDVFNRGAVEEEEEFVIRLKEIIEGNSTTAEEILELAIKELIHESEIRNIKYKNIMKKEISIDELILFIEYLGIVKNLKYSEDIKEIIKKEIEAERMSILLDKI